MFANWWCSLLSHPTGELTLIPQVAPWLRTSQAPRASPRHHILILDVGKSLSCEGGSTCCLCGTRNVTSLTNTVVETGGQNKGQLCNVSGCTLAS